MLISIEEFYQKNKLDNSFNEKKYLLLYPETKDFYQFDEYAKKIRDFYYK